MHLLKNKFVSSTFILILSGMSTKLIGLLIKIIYTRMLSSESIGLYSLVMPTYMLLINIASLAMPITISKLIADNEDIKILNTASIIILVINFILVLLMFISSDFISTYLLHVKEAKYLLNACAITLPFTSLACILKGYFYGKQKMLPHAISNTVEQIIRLLLILFIMPYFIKKSYVHASIFLILTSFFTELSSIITFILCMNKNDLINLKINYFNIDEYHKIMNISLPLVSTRIISNIAYFFEPIIISSVLLKNGLAKSIILTEYGAYNAYAIATLSIPSFFISAIASSLLPELTKYQNNHKLFKKRCLQGIIFALVIGLTSSITITIFRNQILSLLYHSSNGSNYIKILGPFFTLFYLEAILSSILQATNKNKRILLITIISSFSKIIITIILCNLFKNIMGLVYSEIINIIIAVILYIIAIKK